MADYYIDSGRIFAMAVAQLYSRPTNNFIKSGFLKPETMFGGNTQITSIGSGSLGANEGGGEYYRVYREVGANSRVEGIIATNAKPGFSRVSSKFAQRGVERVVTSAYGGTNMEYIPMENYANLLGNSSPYRTQSDRIMQRVMAHMQQADVEKQKYILKCIFADVETGTDGSTAGSTTTWVQDVDATFGAGTATKYTEKVLTDFSSTSLTNEQKANSWQGHVNAVISQAPSMPSEMGTDVYIFLPNAVYNNVVGVLTLLYKDSLRSGAANSDGSRNTTGNYYATAHGIIYVRTPDSWFDRQLDTINYYVCPVVSPEAIRVYHAHVNYNNLLFGNAVKPFNSNMEMLQNIFEREAEQGLINLIAMENYLADQTTQRDVDPIIKTYAQMNNITLQDFYLSTRIYLNAQDASTTNDSQTLVMEARAMMAALRANPLLTRKLLVDPAKTPGLPAALSDSQEQYDGMGNKMGAEGRAEVKRLEGKKAING